jgi:hypothetical protein
VYLRIVGLELAFGVEGLATSLAYEQTGIRIYANPGRAGEHYSHHASISAWRKLLSLVEYSFA